MRIGDLPSIEMSDEFMLKSVDDTAGFQTEAGERQGRRREEGTRRGGFELGLSERGTDARRASLYRAKQTSEEIEGGMEGRGRKFE